MAPGGGAVGKSREDDLEDAYGILGCSEEADDKEIQGAFRKGSLKCHPDRNPDDPEAAEKFDRLQRAKELLLDPARRAEFDRERKGKRELEARHAEEDSKRRKLREDLEAREGAAAASAVRKSEAAAAAEMKKKYAQMDFAARIRAREAELSSKQAEVAAVAAKARQNSEDARVLAKWREKGDAASRAEAVRKALVAFDVRSIAMLSDTEALVQLGSREDALAAVLECRSRRQQLGFRVVLESAAKRPTAEAGSAAAGCAAAGGKPAKAPPRAAPPPEPARSASTGGGAASFDDFEADMLSQLQGLAEAQKAAKAQ